LATKPGVNRFVWNLEWPHPETLTYNFRGRHIDYIEYTLPEHAVPGKTPMNQPPGPLAVPGQYEVVLTVDGKSYRQPLVVGLDPRVHVAAGDLEAQLDFARAIDDWMNISYRSYNDISALRTALATAQKSVPEGSPAMTAASALEKELGEIQEGTNTAPGFGAVNRDVARFVSMIQGSDTRPARSVIENAMPSCVALKNHLARWRKVNSEMVPGLNQMLTKSNLAKLPVVTAAEDPRCPN
jgi:hypothetical protein